LALFCRPTLKAQQLQINAENNVISLAWNPQVSRNYVWYHIYKGIQVDSLVRFKSLSVDSQLKIRDTVQTGYTYYYSVSVEDNHGNEITKSPIVSQNIPSVIELSTNPAQLSVGEAFELEVSFNRANQVPNLSYAEFILNWNSENIKFNPNAVISTNLPGTDETAICRISHFAKSITFTLLPKYLGLINTSDLQLSIPFKAEKEEEVQFFISQFKAEDGNRQTLNVRSSMLKKSIFRTIISSPKGLKVVSGNKKTVLTWNPISNKEIKTYVIYRRTGTAKKRLIAEIPIEKMAQPYFVDEYVDNGKQYFYSIAAKHENGYESDAPQEVEALPDLPYSYNLIAYYPFNESTEDESWHGRVAENVSATFTKDRFGRKTAIELNQKGIGLQIQHDKEFNLNKDFTLSIWINPDSINAFRELFSKIGHDKMSGWSISLLNGIPLFQINKENGETYNAMGFLQLIPNRWYQLVYVYSEIEKKLQLYINGNDQYDEWLNVPVIHSNLAAVLVGGEKNEKDRKTYFDGKLDDIRLYNSHLSAKEIEGLYTIESVPKTPQEIMVAPGMNQIKIHWKANLESDFKRYRLFMGNSRDSLAFVYATQRGMKKDTSLVLTGLIEDEPYFFQMAAEDKNGNLSELSEILEASPIDTGFLLINGLKHYWSFDEKIGAYAYDQYGFSPIKANSRRFFTSKTTGVSKTCADFSQGKNYIDLRRLEPFSNTWTLSFWINWDTFNENETILRLHKNIKNQFSLIRGFQGGVLEWYHNEELRKTLLISPQKNKWYHIIIQKTTPESLSFFINGRKVEGEFTHKRIESIEPQSIALGDFKTLSDYGMFYMDEMSMYERILNENEIRALYNNGAGLSYPFEDEYLFSLFPPVDLKVTAMPRKVFLTWDSQELFNIAYHKIYRGNSAESLDSVGYQAFSDDMVHFYNDTTIQKNKTYYYAVSTVNQAGLESMRSNTALATMAAVEESSIWIDTTSNLKSNWITPTVRFDPVLGSIGYIISIIGDGLIIQDTIRVNGYLIPKPLKMGSKFNIAIQSLFENQNEVIAGPITTTQFSIDFIKKEKHLIVKEASVLNSDAIYEIQNDLNFSDIKFQNFVYDFKKKDAPQASSGLKEIASILPKVNVSKVSTIGMGADDNVNFPLQIGWNVLVNPFQESIKWSKVVANDNPLIIWNGSGFQVEKEMKPDFNSYFYYNSENKSIDLNYFDLIVLKNAFEETDFTNGAELIINANFSSDTGSNRLIITESRMDESINFSAPNALFNVNSLSFKSIVNAKSKETIIKKEINLKEVIASKEQGINLPLLITANIQFNDLELSFAKINWPQEIHLVLINKENGMYWDIQENESIQLANSIITDLELLLGSENYIELQLLLLNQDKVIVYETKPNFNSSLVSLNVSVGPGNYVNWEMFDYLGIQLRREKNTKLQSGWNSFVFDGSKLKKGTYLCRFQVDENVFTKKLVK